MYNSIGHLTIDYWLNEEQKGDLNAQVHYMTRTLGEACD